MFEHISMVLVYYNGDVSVIDKLRDYSNFIYNILVVDNGSNNGFYLDQANLPDSISIIHNENNKGIAFALNQGLQFAYANNSKYLLTMDQDTYITEDVVKELQMSIDPDNNIVSVGPSYIKQMNLKDNTPIEYVDYLITSGNLVSVEHAMNVGGYNNDLFIDGVDIYFSFCLRCQGYNIVRINTVQMEHHIGNYDISPIFHIKHLSHNPERYYYIIRNNIIIMNNFYSRLKKQCMKLHFSFIITILKVVFLERNKLLKIHYIIKGFMDGLLYGKTK